MKRRRRRIFFAAAAVLALRLSGAGFSEPGIFRAFFHGAGFSGAYGGEEAFRWRQCEGAALRVFLCGHPGAQALKRRLADFEDVTGIRVAFAMHPEENYAEKLDAAFADPYSMPDVFAVGAGMPWRGGAAERMLPLDAFVRTPSQTRQSYAIGDFFPELLGVFRRNGELLAVPAAFAGAPEAPEAVWALAAGRRAANPAAAWLFIQYFTGSDFQAATLSEWAPLLPPRRSLFAAPSGDAPASP